MGRDATLEEKFQEKFLVGRTLLVEKQDRQLMLKKITQLKNRIRNSGLSIGELVRAAASALVLEEVT